MELIKKLILYIDGAIIGTIFKIHIVGLRRVK